jgi:hypothetical protein
MNSQLMTLTPIEVECHSGYKADEYPKCFTLDNIKYEINQITDRWYQGDNNPEFPVSNYFKLTTSNGLMFIIKHDLESEKWYLIQ